MGVLARWAADDPGLERWLVGELERLRGDRPKSVAKRATKRLADLSR